VICKEGDAIMKYSLKNDYSEIAHPLVLEAFAAVGSTQFDGYGLDDFTLGAADRVRAWVSAPAADVHFISGGTHANLTVISSALRPHEAVIAPETGHIFVHETGSIEATGHKICTVKGTNGKLNAAEIDAVVKEHGDEQMVKPRLVYVSLSAENGAVYTKSELTEISGYCRKNGLYLYLDGARLGAAINSNACDLTYADISGLVDAFYVGGTKNGALFGEAVVICTEGLKADFRFLMRQRGALMAKGAVIGVQFEALLKDGLYNELAKHSNAMALKMAEGIRKLGFDLLYPAETNLFIPVFPVKIARRLQELYWFYDWQNFGDTVAVRLVTSWATPESIVHEFLADLEKLKNEN